MYGQGSFYGSGNFYGSGLVGGDLFGGKGTVEGAAKNRWLDFVREERQGERMRGVKRRRKARLEAIALPYGTAKREGRAIRKMPKYNEDDYRPRRAKRPGTGNAWIRFWRANRIAADGSKRPVGEVALDYRAAKSRGELPPGRPIQRALPPPGAMVTRSDFTEKRARERGEDDDSFRRMGFQPSSLRSGREYQGLPADEKEQCEMRPSSGAGRRYRPY